MSNNTNQAGKGGKRRPYDAKKWDQAPFWKNKEKAKEKEKK